MSGGVAAKEITYSPTAERRLAQLRASRVRLLTVSRVHSKNTQTRSYFLGITHTRQQNQEAPETKCFAPMRHAQAIHGSDDVGGLLLSFLPAPIRPSGRVRLAKAGYVLEDRISSGGDKVASCRALQSMHRELG